jgi:hypothetical protein
MLNIYEIIEKIRKGEKLTNDEKLLYKMVNNCQYGFLNWKQYYKNRLRKLRDKKC